METAKTPGKKPSGSARPAVFALIVFAIGAASGIFALLTVYRGAYSTATEPAVEASPLSESSRGVLQRLNSPMEIRFYSLLTDTNPAGTFPAFSQRVSQLLAAFAQASGDKVQIKVIDAPTDDSLKAARADGVQAFRTGEGGSSYLGLAIVQKDQKELIPQLQPDWEQALEFDLARAIARLASAQPVSATSAEEEKAVVEQVKKTVPNVESISVEEAARILKARALDNFKAATKELAAEIKQAQEQLEQARQSGSQEQTLAAMKQLAELQNTQLERLKQIGADFADESRALEGIKRGARK